jgi:ribulose-phosphate 3-epimerase
MCGDLLNLEKEIRILEEAKTDLIHFDMMDTTFTNQTMLPQILIPMMRKATDIPLDIHVMINQPERILDELLELCRGYYVQLHVESTNRINYLLEKIKKAGAHPGIALNSGTPLATLEEVIPHVEVVNIVMGNAGLGAQPLDAQILNKIKHTRELADSLGCKDLIIQIDGGVSFEVAEKANALGANAYVLGTKSIYQQEAGVVERMVALRQILNQ